VNDRRCLAELRLALLDIHVVLERRAIQEDDLDPTGVCANDFLIEAQP
jgi:hypothetical protein